jgi:CTP:molybdopterin cytidylyltransferase MocA
MSQEKVSPYPVFVMCGRDAARRKMMIALDPEGRYKSKALLPFLGKRLIEWQLSALARSPYVGKIYLLGLTAEDFAPEQAVEFIPVETTADVSEKFSIGLDYLESRGESPEMVVISSCDAPGVRTAQVNQFFEAIAAQPGLDFALSLVPEDVMEAAFPGSGRVVGRFRDQQVIPGELYALSPRMIRMQRAVIAELNQRRRRINRQKRRIGMAPMLNFIAKKPKTWPLLAKYGLGLATLAEGERALGAAFDCRIKAVIIPDAGFGMDMDLPGDYERLEAFIAQSPA